MKLLLSILVFVPAIVFGQMNTNKVVMIVSSYGKDMGKIRPGYEMDEFSQAYLIFKANGLKIDVASPKGGEVVAGKFNKEKPYISKILADSVAMNLLKNTKPTASLKAVDYDAIYIVGGKGPMFDLVVDPSLQDLISEMNNNKAIVSAVCHGTIAFANIKTGDKYLLDNKAVTGFCNEEEAMFGKTAAEFPFMLEDKLIARSAKYQKGEVMLPFMVKDENFITGQNPYSTTIVAEEIVRAMGHEPVKRKKYNDELSMELVKKAMQGDMAWAKAELKKDKENYDLELIAVYGYYRAMSAKENLEKLRKCIEIIELVTPNYFNEDLYVPLAKYYLTLGEKEKAAATLNDILKKNPGSSAANSLLQEAKK